ncbi:MAG TPA: hypothetical protein VG838_03145 [Opitutaceae bacterium]|nr:hypothetical protein [Opitutaceae bacterium]
MPKSHFFRLKVIGLALSAAAFALAGGCAKQQRSRAENEAEAKALYQRADDFVRKIGEGTYSYEYINFHYDQAMKNIDRILVAYPDTEMAKKLRAGELKLGDYTIAHFRDTVLPQLGDMKEATESVVNCAIYLYNLPEASPPESRAALALILETLCRLVRSDEALIFPTTEENHTLATETIVRVISRGAQQDMALSLVQGAEPDVQPTLAAAYGQGMAAGGQKLAELENVVTTFPAPGKRIELGILLGMIERESNIYRDSLDLVKKKKQEDALKAARAAGAEPARPKSEGVRYDVAAYYQEKFGSDAPPAAVAAFAGFKALQGQLDAARALAGRDQAALVAVVGGYYEYLGLNEKLTGHETLHREVGLGPDGIARCELRLVELLAQNARYAEADTLKAEGMEAFPQLHDQFVRSRMRGLFNSRKELFYLTAKTIPDLDIRDPAVCAEVLLDWFLSPNRLQKGSSWGADQILFKYFSMQKEGRAISRTQRQVGGK